MKKGNYGIAMKKKSRFGKVISVAILSGILGFSDGFLRAQYVLPDNKMVPVDEQKPQEKPAEKKPETTTGKKANPDIVRRLQVKVTGKLNDQVVLTWLPQERNDYLIVARSPEPINTAEKFLGAESIGIIAGNTTTHTDMDLDEGNYFYAVVSKSDVKAKNIFFKAKENFTDEPIRIESTGKSTKIENIVTHIYAKVQEDGSIKLTWRGVDVPGVNYIVYRSSNPINSKEALDTAERIKVVDNGAEFYYDSTMPGTGIYYYAVTLRLPGEIENRVLAENKNFIAFGISYDGIQQEIPRFFKAERKGNNSAAIEWKDAPEVAGVVEYRVYRSLSPFAVKEDLASAKLAGKIKPNVGFFVDQNLPDGKYFYAVVSVKKDGSETSGFIDNRNTQSMSVIILQNVDNIADGFALFSAVQAGNIVQLNWSLKNSLRISPDYELFIYRFTEMPRSMEDIRAGIPLEKVSPTLNQGKDTPPGNNKYFYAIFLHDNGKFYPEGFFNGVNFAGPIEYTTMGDKKDEPQKETDPEKKSSVPESWEGSLNNGSVQNIEEPYILYSDKYQEPREKEILEENKSLETITPARKTEEKISPPEEEARKPVIPEKKKPDTSESSRINHIIRTTYLKNDYSGAVEQLGKIKSYPDEVSKSKVYFYLGLSYYNLGEYLTALKYFSHSLVKKYYKERASFWYKKTIRQIRG